MFQTDITDITDITDTTKLSDMSTGRLPKLPKLQLPMFPGQPPVDSKGPEPSEIPETESEAWPTSEVNYRLQRVQAIIDQGIQNRIRQAEDDPRSQVGVQYSF